MGTQVLLVDDNEEFLDSTKDVLEIEGYQVVTATDGERALSMVETGDFDVILMDIKMPGMNGVEAFVKMKECNPNIKVILFTAYSLQELIRRARKEGVYAIFNKPLEMTKLIRSIEAARQDGKGECILLLDDNKAFCDSLCDSLNRTGYEVAVACDCEDAIIKAQQKSFDILLLDMKLPNLNGLEVYRRIRPVQPELVVIIISGYVEEMKDIIQKALDENAYTCLSKPLDMDRLLEVLKEVSYDVKKDSLNKRE